MSNIFERGTMDTLEMFYIVLFVHVALTIILNVISKKNQKAFFLEYHVLGHDREKYDWDRIIKIRKTVFLFAVFYSLIIIGLTYLFGNVISNIGIFVGAILYVVGLSFGDVKKNTHLPTN